MRAGFLYNSDDVFTAALVFLSIIAAIVSLLLAKLDGRDKRKKYLGFNPRDLKAYSAYISFIAAILVVFFQTRKEINDNATIQERYRQVDKTEALHFDSTLIAIDSTLKLQMKAIDSTDSVLRRQTTQLQNQELSLEANNKILQGQQSEFIQLRKLLRETDAISNSKISLNWVLGVNIDSFSRSLRVRVPSTCYSDDGNGTLVLFDSCIDYFPVLTSVNIFFVSKRVGKQKIADLFLLDTIPPDAFFCDYQPISSKLFFHFFKPELSLGTTSIRSESLLICSRWNSQIEGSYKYETVIQSKDNEAIPFAEIDEMYAVVVLNSYAAELSIDNLVMSNRKENQQVLFSLEKTIIKRKCIPPTSNSFYQTIFIADTEEGWRED